MLRNWCLGRFSVGSLYAQGEAGLWTQPSDLLAAYQDSAGTTAVYQPGAGSVDPPVGKLVDKSGRGNHLLQATAAARMVLTQRNNMLLATATLSTQSVTVTAIPHTLQFTGAGTVALSGVSTAGPLVGGGTLTFTPTAGSLTLTVTGSVTVAQLEVGSTATAYQAVVDASNYATAGFPYSNKLDGVDDGAATAAFSAGTLTSNMDFFVAIKRNSAAQGMLASLPAAAAFFGVFSDADLNPAQAGAGSPTYLVDGTSVSASNRALLHTALTVGQFHILEVRNLDLSAWTSFLLSQFAGYFVNGQLGEMILRPAMTDAQRSQVRRYLGAAYGVTVV